MMVANHQFEPTPLLFGATVEDDAVGILPRSLAIDNWTLWAIAWRCLCDPAFSHFGTVPDRQTNGNDNSTYCTSI